VPKVTRNDPNSPKFESSAHISSAENWTNSAVEIAQARATVEAVNDGTQNCGAGRHAIGQF